MSVRMQRTKRSLHQVQQRSDRLFLLPGRWSVHTLDKQIHISECKNIIISKWSTFKMWYPFYSKWPDKVSFKQYEECSMSLEEQADVYREGERCRRRRRTLIKGPWWQSENLYWWIFVKSFRKIDVSCIVMGFDCPTKGFIYCVLLNNKDWIGLFGR